MITWDTVTDLTGRRPLSDYDRAAILFMAQSGRSMVEIAGAVGRCDGTIKSAIWRFRRDGQLPQTGRRY